MRVTLLEVKAGQDEPVVLAYQGCRKELKLGKVAEF
jgi:hypothetical protein